MILRHDAIDEFATAVVLAPIMFVTPLWAPHVVFRGIAQSRLSRSDLESTRFTLVDTMCLFCFVACCNMFLSHLRSDSPNLGEYAFVLVCNSLTVFTWLRGVKFTNDQQIVDALQRMIVMLVLYPVSVIGSADLIFAVGLMLFNYAEGAITTSIGDANSYWLVLVAVGCSFSLVVVRWLLDRMMCFRPGNTRRVQVS